jgi:hypothetical protein
MAAQGLKTIPSSYGPKDTMDRLEAEVKAKGMTVFARKNRGHFIWPSNLAAPLPVFDISSSASRPPAA